MNTMDISLADLNATNFALGVSHVLMGWAQILCQREQQQIAVWLIGFVDENVLALLYLQVKRSCAHLAGLEKRDWIEFYIVASWTLTVILIQVMLIPLFDDF